jgi:hypothetical protein
MQLWCENKIDIFLDMHIDVQNKVASLPRHRLVLAYMECGGEAANI